MTTLSPEMTSHINLVYSGLADVRREIEKALACNKKGESPFGAALTRLAAVAEGGGIANAQAVREDIFYAYRLVYYLRGGFASTALGIIQPAHLRVADLITTEEAAQILGVHEVLVRVDIDCKWLHPLWPKKQEGDYTSYLDRHEVQARKAQNDETKARIATYTQK